MVIALWWSVIQTDLSAAASSASEYEVKAAMIYNFAVFIEWPPQSFTSPIESMSVCVAGEDPFGKALEANISGKTVRGREMQVRRTVRISDLQTCHIVFISQSERKKLPEILEAVGTAGVLTIRDMKDFASQGGMIEFRTDHEKVRFMINPKAAQRAGLKISYKLLSLATVNSEDAQHQE